MDWNEIAITTTTIGSEAVSQVLWEAGANGVYIKDPADIEASKNDANQWDYFDESIASGQNSEVYVRGYFPVDSPALEFIKKRCVEIKLLKNEGFDPGSLVVTAKKVKDEDWAENWKKYYHAFEVGKRLAVTPSWQQYDTDRALIKIEPGAAFGTGQHETTLMCLELCDEFAAEGMDVLDVGCDTGILGISAYLLGAKSVTAVDRDELAVSATKQNAELNKCRIYCFVNDLAQNVSGKYDLIFANIVADAIIRLVPQLGSLVKDNTIIITSGIIKDREQDVASAAANAGYKVKKRLTSGEWVALALALDKQGA